jgi:U3 small nucleolar RNA-associated protein 18
MPRQRSKKLSENRKVSQLPTSPTLDEQYKDVSDDESGSEIEKDEDEDHLDKLVLGDGAGFMRQLGQETLDMEESYSEGDLEAELGLDREGDLEGVDDTEVLSPRTSSLRD